MLSVRILVDSNLSSRCHQSASSLPRADQTWVFFLGGILCRLTRKNDTETKINQERHDNEPTKQLEQFTSHQQTFSFNELLLKNKDGVLNKNRHPTSKLESTII